MKRSAMNKLLTCILVLIAALCLCAAASASSGSCGDGMTWKLDKNGTLSIYGKGIVQKGNWDEADVKQVLFSSTVSGIGDNVFWGCFHMKYAYLVEGMTSIGYAAFYECDELETVTLPDTLEQIGDFAFGECPSLQELFIPDLLESIGEYAFDYNTVLYSAIGTSGAKALGKAGYAFRDQELGCDLKYLYSGKKETGLALTHVENVGSSYVVPEEVTVIGDQVFYNHTNLRNITLPDHLTSIGDYAFLNCTNLQNVTLPKTLKTIGKSAFCDCFCFDSITIPERVTSIGAQAFMSCSNLESVTIGKSVKTIGKTAFCNCMKLSKVTVLTKKLKSGSLGKNAFKGIAKKAVFKCPKGKAKTYKTLFRKAGAPKTCTFK